MVGIIGGHHRDGSGGAAALEADPPGPTTVVGLAVGLAVGVGVAAGVGIGRIWSHSGWEPGWEMRPTSARSGPSARSPTIPVKAVTPSFTWTGSTARLAGDHQRKAW